MVYDIFDNASTGRNSGKSDVLTSCPSGIVGLG